MTSLNLIGWNVYVGNDPAKVAATVSDWLTTLDPAVVVLLEATHCRTELAAAAAAHGYRHYQGKRGQARGIAVLVRGDARVLRRREAVMTRWWRGPIHGWRQEPRRYPILRLRIAGHTYRLLAAHFPTGGPDAPAVVESLNRARRWMSRGRTSVPAVLVGDVNMSAAALRIHLTNPVARRSRVVAGHGADHLAVRGATGDARTLGTHGSDHQAVLYTLAVQS